MAWPDFLDSFAPDLKEGLEEVRATPRAVLRSQLEPRLAATARAGRRPGSGTWPRATASRLSSSSGRCTICITPSSSRAGTTPWSRSTPRWPGGYRRSPRAATRSCSARCTRGCAGGSNGLDRTGFDGEYDLHGLGMVLMPSAFWTGDPLFSISDDGLRPHVLIYAAHPRGFHGRWPGDDGPDADPAAGDGLSALLGPTRAAVLRALWPPRAAPPSWPASSASARPRPRSTPRSCAT